MSPARPPDKAREHADATTDQASPPLLRIVKGDPTPDEVAALVTVVMALTSTSGPGREPVPSQWRNRQHAVRGTHRPGPSAWRASARTP